MGNPSRRYRALAKRANRKFLRFEEAGLLEPEDWSIGPQELARPAGNGKGTWVPVYVFLRNPPKRKRR